MRSQHFELGELELDIRFQVTWYKYDEIKNKECFNNTKIRTIIISLKSSNNKNQSPTFGMSMQEDRNFYERVYDLVRQIPEGRVTSYGAIARALGTARSARMVGYALRAANNIYPPIPAHRVVNSKGLLSGKSAFGSPTMMQQLLENESVKVVNNQIVNFNALFWKPDQDE